MQQNAAGHHLHTLLVTLFARTLRAIVLNDHHARRSHKYATLDRRRRLHTKR